MIAKKISVVFRLVFPVIAIFLFFLSFPRVSLAKESDELQIHVIDVKKGDAIVLHQPDSCSILIDAGQRFYADRVVNKLNELGVKTLDMVIISHPHEDHFGGLFDILPVFPATKFFDNGYEIERSALFDEYKKLRDLQPYRTIAYGDQLQCGDIKISVLYPKATLVPTTSVNNSSLILMISYHEFRLLHMADLEHDGESTLMEENRDLKADIIKIGHHGMEDATSKALLTMVSPDYAVISSSGKCDGYGCIPDETVLNLLTDLGISYSRTDKDGNIEIIANQDGFKSTKTSKQ